MVKTLNRLEKGIVFSDWVIKSRPSRDKKTGSQGKTKRKKKGLKQDGHGWEKGGDHQTKKNRKSLKREFKGKLVGWVGGGSMVREDSKPE